MQRLQTPSWTWWIKSNLLQMRPSENDTWPRNGPPRFLASVREVGTIMPWDALPEHINEPHEWEGTDWDNWFQRSWIKIKGWFAYGPRSKHWWARWQQPVLKFGYGVKRWEHLKHPDLYLKDRKFDNPKTVAVLQEDGYFPSVVQYWSRAHFLLTYAPGSLGLGWGVSFHWFWPWAKPLPYPEKGDFTIKDMVSVRFGTRWDKDQVNWFPSAAIGGDFV